MMIVSEIDVPNGQKIVLAQTSSSDYHSGTPNGSISKRIPGMNIGATIRTYRLQKGMSQGDIEKRTGLLRCYLSRVENGHTIPSLDTLAKIAHAMEVPLGHFFGEQVNNGKRLPRLSEEEVRFLNQVRRYTINMNDSDRKLVLAMVKKVAAGSGK
jgi:transcriptional regulator with XRE-family HTH domain